MTPLIKPPRLNPGDTIGILSVSGPSRPELLENGVAFLSRCGFGTKVAPNVCQKSGPLGLAGSDLEKARIYHEFLQDEEVKGIVFARGGYGAMRVLPHLDPDLVRSYPKIQCGFSDITAISAFLLNRCGLPSFHGPMAAGDLARILEPPVNSFFPSCLLGNAPLVLEVPEADVVVPGKASGTLVGGCLSLLSALIASPEEFSYDNALLFFEDVGEEAYRIDRMLVSLQRAGRLGRLSGVLVGSMASVTFGGREDSMRLRAVLAERLSSLGVPVALGLPFGHRGANVPFPVGARASWDSEARSLRFLEEIVS